jgi:putative phosphoesterase
MKIIVIADTHMPKKVKELPLELINELKNTDQILHLGDWQTMETYLTLKDFASIDGVAGNVDDEEIIDLFGFKKVLLLNGIRFGLVHGHLGKGRSTDVRALNSFTNEQVDVILFGHSHIPILKQVNDVTLFNPGSPTDKRRQDSYSFGVINIAETLSIHHVFFRKDS